MDYINAFWVGGLICALVQILLDRTKLMPGRIMVILVCTGNFPAFVGVCRCRCERAAVGVWKYSLEGDGGSDCRRGNPRTFYGGISGVCHRGVGGFDFFLSSQLDF